VESSEYGKGDPFDASTALTDEELIEKFRLFTSDILDPARSIRAAESLLGIAHVADVASVVASLRS
jgi:hypothetical protein